MKKIPLIIFIVIVTILVALLSFSYDKSSEPRVYYKVYLEGNLIGKITSKTDLEKYINSEQQEIKDLYNVDEVYVPNGIEIKKELSYSNNVDNLEEIYNKIKQQSDFTVKGYQITISDNDSSQKLYVLSEDIFKESVEAVIKAYVGTEKYQAYLDGNQEEVTETGSYITDVYVDNTITIKEMNVPSTEKIYTNSKDLSEYLLFGETKEEQIHIVKAGDTIEQVAFDNEISVEEFLMSNPKYKSESNILSVGEEVVINVTDPQINVTVSQETTEDVEELYRTVVKYDSNMLAGYESVTQQGENGIVRIHQNEKVVNGVIAYVQQTSKETLKSSVDKIIARGSKVTPTVGDTKNWYWPCDSYRVTSGFGYRIDPFNGARTLHGALDISSPYGSKVYAANNGVVQTMSYIQGGAGIYVVINHNNGYYTQYNHLSAYASNLRVGQTVERGQVIGYVGMTGAATGPHLHFAVWYGGTAYRGTPINPWTLYR